MTSNKIHERAFEFARRIIKLCNRLTERGHAGRHIASELLKCGTSIGANSEEAEDGQTKPDFIAKLCVSRKEARESIYWLRLSVASEIATEEETRWELDEARQLRAMIVQAVKTAQSSTSRG